MERRRFPPPWSVEERQSCFIAKDGNGQALAFVYFEDEPGRRSAENLMSHNEAGALALNIAKLPDLLRKSDTTFPLVRRGTRRPALSN